VQRTEQQQQFCSTPGVSSPKNCQPGAPSSLLQVHDARVDHVRVVKACGLPCLLAWQGQQAAGQRLVQPVGRQARQVAGQGAGQVAGRQHLQHGCRCSKAVVDWGLDPTVPKGTGISSRCCSACCRKPILAQAPSQKRRLIHKACARVSAQTHTCMPGC
jgi:hypothetical protein